MGNIESDPEIDGSGFPNKYRRLSRMLNRRGGTMSIEIDRFWVPVYFCLAPSRSTTAITSAARYLTNYCPILRQQRALRNRRSDSDISKYKMSNFEVINTIQSPLLSDTTQPAIIEFETNYAAYKDRVNRLNLSRPASQRIPPATIRQCVKLEILHSMCILGYIEGANKGE